MQKVNWRMRFKNKTWVTGLVSQTLLMIQGIILALESVQVIDLDLEKMDAGVAAFTVIVNLILAYLSYLGIVIDPSVEGVGDSRIVLNREKPLPEALKKRSM